MRFDKWLSQIENSDFRVHIQHLSKSTENRNFEDAHISLMGAIKELQQQQKSKTATLIQSQSKPLTQVVRPAKPKGIRLVCSSDNEIKTNQMRHISAVRYIPPTQLLMGHYNASEALWNETANSIVPSSPMEGVSSDFPTSFASTRDGKFIAYTLQKNEIQIMDFNLQKVKSLPTNEYPISLAFSPDNQWLVVGHDKTGYIEYWSVHEGFRNLGFQQAHTGSVAAICFHPTDPVFVTVSPSDNVIRLWVIDNESGA